MRRRKKVILVIVAILVVLGAGFVVPTVWLKPWKIEHFYVRTMASMLLDSPMSLSSMRVVPTWADWYSDDLDDASVAHKLERLEWAERQVEIFRRYDRDDVADALSYDVFAWFVRELDEGRAFIWHDYPLNQMTGFHTALPEFMTQQHAIDRARDARSYVERLQKFDTHFEQQLEGLREREERGIVPPRFVLGHVLREMRAFIEGEPRSNVLYTHLAARLDSLGIDARERAEILDGAETAIREDVVPAYAAVIDYVADLETRATDDDGAWKLPDGDAYYDYQLRQHTTTLLGAEEVHALGVREMERVQAEMRRILEAEGYPTDDLPAALETLRGEPRFQWPDDEQGRDSILAEYRRIVAGAEPLLPTLFGRLPAAGVTVDRVPAFRESTSPGAYYQRPPFDGSRPGTFYVNLRDVGEHARFTMRTLAFHEAVPGHHLQLAIMQELEDVPFFRRVAGTTAYIEGWGLYAEQLAAENGLLPTPYDHLGYLQAQLWRAVRLVVDTGIHRKRWTREQAIEFMVANTGLPVSEVTTEIERYIVWPGQATSYMVGRLKILELRDRARSRLGERFDLAEFHDIVLANGALPLVLLERVVDEWMETPEA